jgi:hypothetical protein
MSRQVFLSGKIPTRGLPSVFFGLRAGFFSPPLRNWDPQGIPSGYCTPKETAIHPSLLPCLHFLFD